ncbi:SEC-C metal-binding domain-containing protein [Gracilibacillus xinjiangensis]|uniref:SEC-C metal-binding domain-containing protein n=1 Tax=Gracilibacillus xinjiangensis TaxID=1193282 RepID=A0ABV8WRK1_9BACI
MTVGRNDPCSCGSGKKYKKCCMKKDQMAELKMFKEEKFYKQKEALVAKLNEFLLAYLTLNIYAPLETEFNRRTNNIFEKNSKGFFLFWLHFFKQYDNGLRGIEWFLAEEGNRLSHEEKEMAERWANMKPQLLQVVNQTNEMVTVMDCYSRKSCQLPKSKQNIPHVLPWTSTLGLLEPVNDVYYFNGIRALVSPRALTNAKQLVEEKVAETNLDHEQVMIDYYPEVLAAFHMNDTKSFNNEKEVTVYNYRYKLLEKNVVEEYLAEDPNLTLDQSNTKQNLFIWLSDTGIYEDNQVNGEVLVAKVNATIKIEEENLYFSSYDQRITELFTNKLKPIDKSIELLEDKKETMTVSNDFEMQQLVANPSENVPNYFSVYAQTMSLLKLDEPIPEYGHQSLRELVQNDKKDLAENWLRKMEYELTKVVEEHFGKVEISPDFNTPRKELGLPISPFVTGGEERVSRLNSATVAENQDHNISIDMDSPAYETLGFTNKMVTAFYAKDIIAFYQEKTDGKAKTTERKYRNTIKDIIDVLEIRAITSWEQCDLKFWERLLTEDIIRMYSYITKSYVKAIITTVKALAKWLAQHEKVMLEKEINQIAKKYEPTMTKIAQLWDSEMTFQIPEETLSKEVLMEKLVERDENIAEIEKGSFKVIEVNENSENKVRTVNTDINKEQTVTLKEGSIPFVEKGMVLVMYIGKEETTNTWKNVYLESIYFHID